MQEPVIAPYGSWRSPITAEEIVKGSVRLDRLWSTAPISIGVSCGRAKVDALQLYVAAPTKLLKTFCLLGKACARKCTSMVGLHFGLTRGCVVLQ